MKNRFFIHRETDWTTDEIVKNGDTSPYVTGTIQLDDNVSSADKEGEKFPNKFQEDNERDDDGSQVPITLENTDPKQYKLMRALFSKTDCDKTSNSGGGSKSNRDKKTVQIKLKERETCGTTKSSNRTDTEQPVKENFQVSVKEVSGSKFDAETKVWRKHVDSWYENFLTKDFVDAPERNVEDNEQLIHYQALECAEVEQQRTTRKSVWQQNMMNSQNNNNANWKSQTTHSYESRKRFQNNSFGVANWPYSETKSHMNFPLTSSNHMQRRSINNYQKCKVKSHDYHNEHWTLETADKYNRSFEYVNEDNLTELRKQYRASVGNNLVVPRLSINPKNVRCMTIGKPISFDNDNDTNQLVIDTNQINGKKDKYITQIDYNSNDTDILTNTSYNKGDSVLEDFSAIEVINSSVRNSTPDIFQDNVIIEDTDNKTKCVNDVVNDICCGSQPNNCHDFKEGTEQQRYNSAREALKTFLKFSLPSKNKCITEGTVFEENPTCSYDKDIELSDFQVPHSNKEDVTNGAENDFELVDLSSKQKKTDSGQGNLKEISSERLVQDNIQYFTDQPQLLYVLEIINIDNSHEEQSFTFLDDKNEKVQTYLSTKQTVAEPVDVKEGNLHTSKAILTETNQIQPTNVEEFSNTPVESPQGLIQISTSEKTSNEPHVICEPQNNASVFLTLPNHLVSSVSAPVQLQIENNVKLPDEKSKQKKDKSVNSRNKKAMKKTALRTVLLEQLFNVVGKGTVANNEVGLPNN